MTTSTFVRRAHDCYEYGIVIRHPNQPDELAVLGRVSYKNIPIVAAYQEAERLAAGAKPEPTVIDPEQFERLQTLVNDLWSFIENVGDDDPERTSKFFALRERVSAT